MFRSTRGGPRDFILVGRIFASSTGHQGAIHSVLRAANCPLSTNYVSSSSMLRIMPDLFGD